MNLLKKVFLTPINAKYMVMLLRTSALLLVFILILLVVSDWDKNKILIAALGVLISALLASYSVVLNLETTMALKNREHSNLIRYIFFQFCGVKGNFESLKLMQQRDNKTGIDMMHIFDKVDEIDRMLNELKSKDVISILHNDILTKLHFLFLYSNTTKAGIKSMRESIDPSLKLIANSPIPDNNELPNSFLDPSDQIETVNSILNYLKTGYHKEFPERGGIEDCGKINFVN